METLIIIPARYASTRFPGKPLALIQGKPMIQCTYEQVQKTGFDVVVATDDCRIIETIYSFSGQVVMTATTHLNGTSRVAEAVEKVEKDKGKSYQTIVNVQGDEPFIKPEDIQKLVALLQEQNNTIGTLCKRIEDIEELLSPHTVKVVKNNKDEALYFSRAAIPYLRDVAPKGWLEEGTYYKHIGLYAFSKKLLPELIRLPVSSLEKSENLEQLRWLQNGYTIKLAETLFESIGIDTPEDLEKINQME